MNDDLKHDLKTWRGSLQDLSSYALQNEPATKEDLARVLGMLQALVDAHGAPGKAGKSLEVEVAATPMLQPVVPPKAPTPAPAARTKKR